jgi:hypothetical protein
LYIKIEVEKKPFVQNILNFIANGIASKINRQIANTAEQVVLVVIDKRLPAHLGAKK